MNMHRLVLVVDDDQEILRMVSCILELEGYGVGITADGSSVLTLYCRSVD